MIAVIFLAVALAIVFFSMFKNAKVIFTVYNLKIAGLAALCLFMAASLLFFVSQIF